MNMKKIHTSFHQALFTGLFCLIVLLGQAQMTTTNLYPTQDSYVTSQYPGSNYGNSSLTSGTVYYIGSKGVPPSQYHRRAYVQFNMSSIPSNAVIYSARLMMTRTTSNSGTFDWKVKRVTSSWTEFGIKQNTQPTISTASQDIVTKTPATSGLSENFDVKNMVERMVYGSASNNGWVIQVSNESANSFTGSTFYSREASQNVRPKLEVKWFTPISVSNVNVNHESGSGQSDGSISFSISGGASSSYSYVWTNSSGQQISTSSSVSGLTYGWYGVHITGTYGEELYQAFLVGQECASVDITFQPDKYYTEDAWLYGRTNFENTNYGESSYFRSENVNSSGGWFPSRSLLKFNLWIDPDLSVDNAEMTLTGWSSYGTNPARIDYVTSHWNEDFVTHNTQPLSNTSVTELIPQTTSSNQNAVIDMVDFWNDWQATPSNNRGVLFQLQSFPNVSNRRQLYYSPSTGTSSRRPKTEFTVRLLGDYACDENYFFYPKEEIEETIAYVPGDEVRVRFQEDYFSASSTVSYQITDLSNDVVQSGTLTAVHGLNWLSLQNGVGGITLTTGKIYLVEISNAKGQKMYLKVKMA